MVAVRRIKHLVQLSAVGLLVLTFVIFIQWDEISYASRFKRQGNGLREQLEYSPDLDLLELEHELDVDRIMKKIHDDVTFRLMREEEDCNKAQELATSTRYHQGKELRKANGASKDIEQKSEIQSEIPSSSIPTIKARGKQHRRPLKPFKWQTYPWKSNMRGQLNVHIWQAWCGNTIHDLRRNWFFPLYPDLHLTVSRFFVQHYEDDYGQRIFGYIHPPLTGKYIFAMSSDDTSELWLSKNEHPENVRLLAWVGNRTSLDGYYGTNVAEFSKYKTQLSKQVFLKEGRRYFIEALHKQGARKDHILVGWKVPGLSRFRYISGDSISMYIDDRYTSADVTEYAKFIPQTLPSHSHPHSWSVVLKQDIHKFGSNKDPIEYQPHELIERNDFRNILPNCTYEPSYLVNFTLKRYEGVKLIHDSAVYPNDLTILTHMIPYDKCRARRSTDSHGNSFNVSVSALTNHSLFEEGRIKVFGPDGKDSVITKLSDLDEDYPVERLVKSDEFNLSDQVNQSLDSDNNIHKGIRTIEESNLRRKPRPLQSQQEAVIDNDERKHLLNEIRKHPLPLQKQRVKIQDLKVKGTNSGRIDSSVKKRRLNTAGRRPETVKSSELLHYETKMRAVTSAPSLKLTRGRQGKKNHNIERSKISSQTNRKVNLASKVSLQRESTLNKNRSIKMNKTERIIHVNFKLPVSSSKPIARKNVIQEKDFLQTINGKGSTRSNKLQRTTESSHKVDGNSRKSSERDKNVLQRNSGTRRKLLFYPSTVEVEDVDDNKDTEAQERNARITHDAVPRFYFRPIGTIAHNRSMPSFIYEDRQLSRLNSAREYVRRMQSVIQAYQHPMSARQISDQIYRRYGIRITVPEMKPYLNYNPLVYHHNTTKCASDGNIQLNEHVAKSVVSRYMKELTKKNSNKYTLERIVNVQENHDVMYGDRYLMELKLLDRSENKSVRLSQYLYQKSGQSNLCLPYNFQIDHHATVHVIVPVKNQGRWVQYFIDDMSELYLKTRDPHLNVIIVDFSSDDIDVEEALRRSPLVRYKVITLSGPFQRAFGIQAGSTAVKNPNDIIFMCDLHLELPNNMIDIIRKHCIKRKMAFAPVVTRLHCGFTPTVPFGFWELEGYGLFAMYKSDFTRVGGMNYREFGTRWGGEDWELLDRVLLRKMEVERLRIPNFYHFYHSKKGMWGSPTTDAVMSDISDHYQSRNQIIPLYKRNVVKVSTSHRAPGVSAGVRGNVNRQLRRKKRRPSRMVRPPSRIRRGYRPRKRLKPVEIELERE